MRVLIVHNRYRQAGGEDAVVQDEARLLTRNGFLVEIYQRSNDELDTGAPLKSFAAALWSRRTHQDLTRQAGLFRPDVVHVHNTFPLVSPAAYYAFAKSGTAVVQTLHNFRLFCVQAMLLRNGRVCEDCLGRGPWRGVVHRCYRGSLTQSAAAASVLTLHRAAGTYGRRVTRYIALNDFCRRKFVAAGLPADRIAVKPNFVDLPAPPPGERRGGLFVGRLAPEKGCAIVAQSMRTRAGAKLDVIGTGPCGELLADVPGVRLLGWRGAGDVHTAMRAASWLILPSIWYEAFPRVLVEAYACGLPVIASRIGALAELIQHGETGLLCDPDRPQDFAAAMDWADAHPVDMLRMGRAARRVYENLYTPEVNLRQLEAIYRDAIRISKK